MRAGRARRAGLRACAFAWGAALSGCAALQGAQGGLSSATGAVNDTRSSASDVKSTAQGTKADVDDSKTQIAGLKKKKDGGGGGAGGGGANGGDPDGDDRRAIAKEGKLNEPITDSLDPAKGDAIDWKYFELGGRPGKLTVEIHWDDENALLNLDVFDALGENIASAPGREGAQALRVSPQIDQPGKIYVKVALNKRLATDYTFIAKWAGGGGGGGGNAGSGSAARGGAVAASEVPNPGAATGGPPPGAPAPPAGAGAPPAPGAAAAPPAPAEDPLHPRAKIVQSYREGADLVIYLDKGSGANIKAGMTGAILEGDSEKLLDGGTIKISKVVDATHSVAKAQLPKIGKNKTVIINLVK